MKIFDLSPAYYGNDFLIKTLDVIEKDINENNIDLEFDNQKKYELIASELGLRGISRNNIRIQNSIVIEKWKELSEKEIKSQIENVKKNNKDDDTCRIIISNSLQKIWSQHKYSIMARDISMYKNIGKELAKKNPVYNRDELFYEFVTKLRTKPKSGGIRNALEHMWGYVSDDSDIENKEINNMNSIELLRKIQSLSTKTKKEYLLNSIALSELEVWID